MSLYDGLQHIVIRFRQVDHLMQVFVAKYAPLRMKPNACAVATNVNLRGAPSMGSTKPGNATRRCFACFSWKCLWIFQGSPLARTSTSAGCTMPPDTRESHARTLTALHSTPIHMPSCAYSRQAFKPLAPNVLFWQVPSHQKTEGDVGGIAIQSHL